MSGLNSLGKDGFVDLNGMCLKDYFNKNVLSNLCPRFKKKMHSLCCIKMYVFCFACLFFFFSWNDGSALGCGSVLKTVIMESSFDLRKDSLSCYLFFTFNQLVSGHRHPIGGSSLKAVGAFDETRGHWDHRVLSFRIWKNKFPCFQVQ